MAIEDLENAVKGWVSRSREASQLEHSLSQTYHERDEWADKLADLIVPSDMEAGEVISVWVSTGRREERLVTVKLSGFVAGRRRFEVSFRGKPKVEPETQTSTRPDEG